MASEWKIVGKARKDFADLLEGLNDEQLASQSLCEEWSVLDVGGHIVSLVELSPLQLTAGVAKHRGNADAFLSIKAKDFSASGAGVVAKKLRAKAGKPLRPFSEASMVVDTAVHTLDVTRPLGLPSALDAQVLLVALDYSAGELIKKQKEGAPRLEATDSDWTQGNGPIVRGTSEALLLALNGREVTDELEGEGVRLLP